MSAAYLVHQQHEDEAQHQGDADAGVQLLVAVLVFPRGVQSRHRFRFGLRHFGRPGPTVAVVSACVEGTVDGPVNVKRTQAIGIKAAQEAPRIISGESKRARQMQV